MTFDEKTTITFSKMRMERIAKMMEAWEKFSKTGAKEDYELWQDMAEEIALHIYGVVKDLPF